MPIKCLLSGKKFIAIAHWYMLCDSRNFEKVDKNHVSTMTPHALFLQAQLHFTKFQYYIFSNSVQYTPYACVL